MASKLDYEECTSRLPEDALRIFEHEDLASLRSLPPVMLLEDVRAVFEAMARFRRACSRALNREEYTYLWSVFQGALLKLSAALRETGAGGLDDPLVRQVSQMFTDVEVNAVIEFEKFSKLDPDVTPPERLADLLVSRSGEIYELVAEAVRKQYVDFSSLIKTWSMQGSVRDAVSKALQMRYERRFRNIVEAVKRLLDQQPAWLLRLFSDYEQALLESAALRERIEAELREKVEAELGLPSLRAQLEELRRERDELVEKVSLLSAQAAAGEMKVEQLEAELERLRRERAEIDRRREKLERSLETVRRLLRESMNRLEEKEAELRDLREKYSEDKAAREALEAEAERLRSRIAELEETLREYEAAAQSLEVEREMLSSKLEELESAIRGEGEERLVTDEEAIAYEAMFIERFNYHMNRLPLTLYDPLRRREVRVSKWGPGDWESTAEAVEGRGPRRRRSRYTVREGFVRKKTRMVVEALYYARPEEYAAEGYDKKPMSLSEALEIASQRAEEARSGGYYHVLIIASPTGFASKLRGYVGGREFHRVFLSSHLALELFDPVTGEVYHHPEDPAVEKLRPVLAPLASFEEVARVADAVKAMEAEATARYPTKPYVLLSEVAEKTGASPETVRAALAKLEKEGYGYVALYKGEQVFFYKVKG